MGASDLAVLVKQAADIVDVIGRVVVLRRAGHRHIGLCPFHQEKTPSFHVDPESQFFHCFGCGQGGDVVTFVMKHQSLSFSDAVRHLADRYHVVLPEQAGGAGISSETVRRERETLYRVVEAGADYFYGQLHHSSAGREARDYLNRRGIPHEVVEVERMGYAPDSWDGLLRHLERSGFDLALAEKVGLIARGARDRVYDRFRHRLIFPIRDDQSRVVAFGGRSLPRNSDTGARSVGSPRGEEPKYLNSPESPLYHKGRMLYQLARAREACRSQRQVLLVEGYMDLLAFHVHGFHRVVATLGTALTPHQVRLLARMVDEVVLAYDGDEAGEKAMLRALPLFLEEELTVSCIRFPRGMDPDDFLKAGGMDGLLKLVSGRVDLGRYAMDQVLERWDGSIGGKSRAVDELKPLLRSVRQPVLKAEYVRVVAGRLSIPEGAVLEQVDSGGGSRTAGHRAVPRRPRARVEDPGSLEESIVRLMIHHPALIDEVERSGAVGHFSEGRIKALAEVLLRIPHPPSGEFRPSAVFEELEDPDLKGLLTRFMMESGDLADVETQLGDWLGALCHFKPRRSRLCDLSDALDRAQRDGNMAEVKAILGQIQSLQSIKKKGRRSTPNH
ncbi:MAG: DNA primase [Syntrophobacteraceae bacterium]|nr:DNA primase [Syntrophobacteraceae bacterium]